jgi:hypothetical protein
MGAAAIFGTILAGSAFANNKEMNKQNKQQQEMKNRMKTEVVSPNSDTLDEEETEIKLGSDRASSKKDRLKGRRQLMTPQATSPAAPSTGVQI